MTRNISKSLSRKLTKEMASDEKRIKSILKYQVVRNSKELRKNYNYFQKNDWTFSTPVDNHSNLEYKFYIMYCILIKGNRTGLFVRIRVFLLYDNYYLLLQYHLLHFLYIKIFHYILACIVFGVVIIGENKSL